MIKVIHENYPAFYNMLIAVTALGNNSSPEFDKDAGKIIEFIGKAFFLDDDVIKYCKKMILDELVTISVREDINAFVNSHDYDSKPEEIDSLLMMKCDAINVVESLGNVKNVNLNPDWFNYSHYKPYYPLVRYRQLCLAASTGNPIANKVTAVMCYLGIGVEKKDVDSAVYRLKQCLMWGDMSSIYFLKLINASRNNEREEKVFTELLTLIKYFEDARTVLPEEAKQGLNKHTLELFAVISSIKQDIVINFEKIYIDYSFVEVMLSDEIDYYTKLGYINKYQQQEWKEATNSSDDPHKKIGFKLGE